MSKQYEIGQTISITARDGSTGEARVIAVRHPYDKAELLVEAPADWQHNHKHLGVRITPKRGQQVATSLEHRNAQGEPWAGTHDLTGLSDDLAELWTADPVMVRLAN